MCDCQTEIRIYRGWAQTCKRTFGFVLLLLIIDTSQSYFLCENTNTVVEREINQEHGVDVCDTSQPGTNIISMS